MNSFVAGFSGQIRRAKSADYPQIGELARQLGYASMQDEITRRMAGMEDSKEHAVFVAETEDGEIAGWMGLFVIRTVEADARVEISGLVVDERFRCHGVGERLLERAEQWARETNCSEIGLRSNVIRERAHAFYERHGYELIKTQKSFRKRL